MIEHQVRRVAMRGLIRRRVLVNALVDPDEAAARLPTGLREHRTPGGTVVGCCLLDLDELRPASFPRVLGARQRAAAHRISVEWDGPDGETTVGVWVPGRRSSSRLAVVLGGRWFPGVHKGADISFDEHDGGLRWDVDDGDGFALHTRVMSDVDVAADDFVGQTCVSARVGVSPDHHGRLEAVRMQPGHCRARSVVVAELDSSFIDGFETARPAPAYLMEQVPVTWTPALLPRIVPAFA